MIPWIHDRPKVSLTIMYYISRICFRKFQVCGKCSNGWKQICASNLVYNTGCYRHSTQVLWSSSMWCCIHACFQRNFWECLLMKSSRTMSFFWVSLGIKGKISRARVYIIHFILFFKIQRLCTISWFSQVLTKLATKKNSSECRIWM